MTRKHATPDGEVNFTLEEEAEADAREAQFAADAPKRAYAEQQQRNAPMVKIQRNDILERRARELDKRGDRIGALELRMKKEA